jgi:hypothetical protein
MILKNGQRLSTMTGEKSEKKFPGENLPNFRRKIGGFSGLRMAATGGPCPA